MQSITFRELQRLSYDTLKAKLPLKVNVRGKEPFYVVDSQPFKGTVGDHYKLIDNPTLSETYNRTSKIASVQEKKNIKSCKHGSMIGLCKHNCKK